MRIGTREVGPGAPVFVIAECGSNHGGSLDAALALIDAAAEAGAGAAKFQRFRVDSFLVPRPDPESLRRYELPDEWLPKLRARCDERGVEFLCTAFDLASLDVVDPYVNAHKIGSTEAPRAAYADAVAAKRKPIIFSAGQSMIWSGDLYLKDTIVLACRQKYPAPIDRYLYPIPSGYAGWGVSDHTLDPTTVPAAAVALGACVVEKHVRSSRAFYPHDEDPFPPDWWHSIDIDPDFRAMVRAIRATERAVRR